MPSPGTEHRIEFGVPEDELLLLLRVLLDGEWSGDLLFASSDARSAFLDALTSGAISVVRRPIPLADVCTELEIAPATSSVAAEVQDRPWEASSKR